MKKMYFMIISIIVFVFLFVTCDKTDVFEPDTKMTGSEIVDSVNENELQSIRFQVGVINNTMGSGDSNLLTIIRSKEELNIDNFNKNFTENYDNEYFTENALVLYLFGAGNTGGKLDVTNMHINGNELTIFINFDMGDATAISQWTVVLEVSQADVYGVTDIIIAE